MDVGTSCYDTQREEQMCCLLRSHRAIFVSLPCLEATYLALIVLGIKQYCTLTKPVLEKAAACECHSDSPSLKDVQPHSLFSPCHSPGVPDLQ